MTEKLRLAGRTDFLTILVGSDTRSRAAVMTPDETAFLVQMLTANKEWARLWALVFTLPLVWGMRVVQSLARSAWTPEAGDERATVELVFDPSGAVRVTHLMPDEEDRRTFFWMNEHSPTFLVADPPAKQGEPRFAVELSIDGNKRLLITARDLQTGRVTHRDYPVIKLT